LNNKESVGSKESLSSVVLNSCLSIPDIADPQLDWKPLDQHLIQPASCWVDWLLDRGSLTQLLIKKSKNQFRVEVVAEEWVSSDRIAASGKFGPVSPQHRFWSRKVILHGAGQPWVMAHTLLPEHSLSSPLQEVMALKNKPLGEYLFSHPDLLRTGIDVTAYREGADSSLNSWGRRSLFYLFDKPVMVAEYYLTQLFED
jgi:chorismate--pyruvate lyase